MFGDVTSRLALLAAGIALVGGFLAGAITGGLVGSIVLPACPDCPACPECAECPVCPECHEVEEYYRGVYDLCVSFEVGSAFCLRAIGDAYDDGRHETLSPGWRWPPSMEPEAVR